jgi:hypothetical protein
MKEPYGALPRKHLKGSSFHEEYAPAHRCINGAGRMKPYGRAERVRPTRGNRTELTAPFGVLPRK